MVLDVVLDVVLDMVLDVVLEVVLGVEPMELCIQRVHNSLKVCQLVKIFECL